MIGNLQKSRVLSLIAGLILFLLACHMLLSKTTLQFNLSIVFFLGLIGVILFDSSAEVFQNKINITFFLMVSAGGFLFINQSSKELFFLEVAGSFTVLNFYEELRRPTSKSRVFLQAPWLGTFLFSNIMLVECNPQLKAEGVFFLDLIALIVLGLQELLMLGREKGLYFSGNYVSALRTLMFGFTCYTYGRLYLPEIAKSTIYIDGIGFGLIFFASLCGLMAILLKATEEKLLLLQSSWHLFFIWAFFSASERGLEFVSLILVSSWLLVMYRARFDFILSRLFIYFGPAFFLMFPLLGATEPKLIENINVSALLWFVPWLLHWVGQIRRPWANWVQNKRPTPQEFGMGFVLLLFVLVWAASLNVNALRERL